MVAPDQRSLPVDTPDQIRLETRVVGAGLSPEMLWITDVTKLVETIARMVIAIVRHDNPGLDLRKSNALALSAIQSGSLVAEIVSFRPEVGCAWRKVTDAIEREEFAGLPPVALKRLQEVRDFNKRYKTGIEFWQNNGVREKLAVLTADTRIVEPAFIWGTTTLYGELRRIGGDNPPAADLHFLDGTSMRGCQIQSTELAARMAKRLYDTIGVRGMAKWNVTDMSLCDFSIENITEYQNTSLVKALDSLGEVSEEHYRKIDDYDKFIDDLRGRDSDSE